MPETLAATIAAWVDGWSLSRGSGRPEVVREGFFLRVDSATEVARFVLSNGDDESIRLVAARVSEPATWLKVPGTAATVMPQLGPVWRVGQPLALMATVLATADVPSAPTGYRVRIETGELTTQVVVETSDGELSARGRIGVGESGVVFDAIVTTPEHQRRGLGSLVMSVLGNDAIRRGQNRGILMASEQGRLLYRHLGWQLVSPFTEAHFVQCVR
jgi:GNAT superfamily N-acetyltransferase